MALTGSVSGKVAVSGEAGNVSLNRAVSLTPTGTNYLYNVQTVGTAAAALVVNDLGSMRFLGLQLNSTANATVTVTMAAVVLKPGDVAILPNTGTGVTLQATAAATDVTACGLES